MLLQHASDQAQQAYAPPMSTWSPQVELLTSILDAVRESGVMAVMAAGAKGIQPPKPSPRPKTALQRVQMKVQMEQHEALVARFKALAEAGAPTMAQVAAGAVEITQPSHGKVDPDAGEGQREES